MLKEYALSNKMPYVDFYTLFVDDKGGLLQKYSPDGVHPNLEGYKIMEKIVSDELMKIKLRSNIIY
jgi:lysophospholipase L1-like esterase